MNETPKPRSMTPFIVVLSFVILMSAILIAYRNLMRGDSSFFKLSRDPLSSAERLLAEGNAEGAWNLLSVAPGQDSVSWRIAMARCRLMEGNVEGALRILREAEAAAPWDPILPLLIRALQNDSRKEGVQ